MEEFKWFIIGFIVLFALWYIIGGSTQTDVNKPFLNQPQPISTGQPYSSAQLHQNDPALFSY